MTQLRGDKHRARWREATGVFCALIALFLIDAALFRSPIYPSVLDPESTSGRVEMMQWVETHRKRSAAAQVIAFGDSRMGFLPRVATAAAGSGIEFASAAVPGTSPRTWYYQLRDLDPDRRHYSAILLPVDDYDDEDRAEDPADSLADLSYAVGRLRLSDVFDFARSFPSWYARWAALRGLLFKSTVYKDDVHAFLLAPEQRRQKVAQYRRDSANWYRNFAGSNHSVDGVTVDWKTGTLHVPPGTTPAQEKTLHDVLLRRVVPQTGRLAAYRREWFGRILGRYRGTPVRIIIFRLPRGPIPRPDSLVKKLSSSIRELAGRPNVILLDEHLLDALEHTGYFMDPLHLNSKGMDAFSHTLGLRVAERLRGAQAD